MFKGTMAKLSVQIHKLERKTQNKKTIHFTRQDI